MIPPMDAAQQEIVDEFAFFGDWAERYQYLIELGRKLPPFPEHLRSEQWRVHGCQSMVWMVPGGTAAAMEFQATSDSAIVCGLIALLLRVYQHRSAQDILQLKPEFIERIGLGAHLSPTRKNGLNAMLARIQAAARDSVSTASA